MLSSVALSRTNFAVTQKSAKGAKVYYKLSEAALVSWTASIKTSGRKKGKKCSDSAKKGAKCTFYRPVKGTIKTNGAVGVNSFNFGGYMGKTKLKPGTYMLIGVATDAAGNKSKPVSKAFKIKK